VAPYCDIPSFSTNAFVIFSLKAWGFPLLGTIEVRGLPALAAASAVLL